MGKNLLSVDWDYFIRIPGESSYSYTESKRNVTGIWYKRFLLSRSRGTDIREVYRLSEEAPSFWKKIRKYFQFNGDIKGIVSDSHVLSYSIAKEYCCDTVYLFDAHSDLGYGGISALDFELNCANWLGKLLKEKAISRAYIVYSPFTMEKPSYFSQMNRMFDIQYIGFDEMKEKISLNALHICRSGAWTPPWYDNDFLQFIREAGVPVEVTDCPERKWNTENMSLSEQIDYWLA